MYSIEPHERIEGNEGRLGDVLINSENEYVCSDGVIPKEYVYRATESCNTESGVTRLLRKELES